MVDGIPSWYYEKYFEQGDIYTPHQWPNGTWGSIYDNPGLLREYKKYETEKWIRENCPPEVYRGWLLRRQAAYEDLAAQRIQALRDLADSLTSSPLAPVDVFTPSSSDEWMSEPAIGPWKNIPMPEPMGPVPTPPDPWKTLY